MAKMPAACAASIAKAKTVITTLSIPPPFEVRQSEILVHANAQLPKPFFRLANLILSAPKSQKRREEDVVTAMSRVVFGRLVSVFGPTVRERVSEGCSDVVESGE
jgi:hypothetical protein